MLISYPAPSICHIKNKEIGERLSGILNVIAIVLLAAALGLAAWVLIYGKVNGYLPDGPWGDWTNSHGPWRYTFFLTDTPIYKLRMGLGYSFILLLFSIIASGLSWIMKHGRIKTAAFTCGIVAMILYCKYLYWLID
jgi:hypothetical protein